MLIRFAVSNFLSFDEKQELSLQAGKTRNNSDRIYTNRRLRLVKCNALFGANGAGKSNLIKGIRFFRHMIVEGFPSGFSNSYYRLNANNRLVPSEFEAEIICNNRRLSYGFSVILNTGIIAKEWLFETTPSNLKKYIYERDTENETFSLGGYFKDKKAIEKIKGYGIDSAGEHELLFLHFINKGMGKMFSDFPELSILKDVYEWFWVKLTISAPQDFLKGYPYFEHSNPIEIAQILNSLGTGICNIRFVDVPKEIVKNRIPSELYNDIVSDLEKLNAKRKKAKSENVPQIMARGGKDYYNFSIDINDNILVKTIEFEHETKTVFFNLAEESDGTARLFDLIEILLPISNDCIYVIDEIDRCLHPALTAKIISVFLKLAKNRNTQLIITTHESRLLKNNLLRNDEISFMIKTENGSTIIKSLDKYQLRADKKVYEALFDGTIDAIPHFNEKALKKLTSI